MSESVKDAATLLGRVLLAALFLHEAWSKLTGYSAAVAYAQAFGLPGSLIPLAIVLEVGCGILILVGYHARAAALLLASFCLSRRIWRLRAACSCSLRTAPEALRSTRCARRRGLGRGGPFCRARRE